MSGKGRAATFSPSLSQLGNTLHKPCGSPIKDLPGLPPEVTVAIAVWGHEMRRFSLPLVGGFLAVAVPNLATAADIPAPVVKAPPAAVVATTWTGFYVGSNLGYGWGNRNLDYTPNDPGAASFLPVTFGFTSQSFDTSGVIGGLQIGYNYQFSRNWLIGLETDFNWSAMRGGSSAAVSAGNAATSVDEHIRWFGTVRARLGYLPVENFLAYVTGGFAYGKVEHTGSVFFPPGVSTGTSVSPFSLACFGPATCTSGSSSDIATGWTLGGGLEYAFSQNWTVKAEYLYVSLARTSVTQTATAVVTPGDTPLSYNANFNRGSFNIARIGVNYRF